MIHKYITIILLVVILVFLYKSEMFVTSENFTDLSVSSNEAIQNLSSAYNSGNATLTNLTVTGSIKIGDVVIDPTGVSVGSIVTNKNGIKIGNSINLLPTPNASNNLVEIYPNSDDSTAPYWYFAKGDKQFGNSDSLLYSDGKGNLNMKGNAISYSTIPGAYIVNGSSSSAIPIFKSIENYIKTFGAQNFGNFYIVLPGYKVVAYSQPNYNTTKTETYDNTTGTVQKLFTCSSLIKNNDMSCQLYYNNVLIS